MFKILKRISNKLDNKLYSLKFKVKYFRYKNKCQKKLKKEFIIFNTPVHGNIGDHAIIYAEKNMLNKLGVEVIEVPTRYSKQCFNFLKEHVSNDAIISITGGGFIGSQWMSEEDLVIKVIDEFKENKLIIFPQTIFFKNDEKGIIELNKSVEVFNKAKNLIIFAREKKTYEFAKKIYINAKVELVPDIVLSLNKFEFTHNRKDILLCFRNDPEKIFSDEYQEYLLELLKKMNLNYDNTDTVLKKNIKETEREKVVINKLEEFSKYKIVITDRLHGMIFASLTNTPCIVFGNYNYKIEGVYEWIKDIDENIIFEKNISNLEKDINILLKSDIKAIGDNRYNKKFEILYKDLEEING